jgi:hypothetical protein
MGSPDVIQYQKALRRLFNTVFDPPLPQEADWDPFLEDYEISSPQFDYAVGPFAKRKVVFDDEYEELMEEHDRLFRLLIDTHNHNIQDQHLLRPLKFKEVRFHNQNARALILIDIVRKKNQNHILGSIINASLLGKVGIMVAWDEERFDAIKQQMDYVQYLYKMKLFGYKPRNLMIFDHNQLLEILNYCH